MTTALRTGSVLVFDGDCGFCTTSVTWLAARFPGAFATVPYQRTDLDALGLTERECDEKVQWIGDVTSPVTTRSSGAAAVGALLRVGGRRRRGVVGTLSRGLGVLAVSRPTSWAAEAIYTVIAANRQRLPGGTPACAL
ncbi:MAG TPA: DCC1-like thiol-disulfide oxidoreductase family protein [Candidatus Nanopelagicales bacterium]|nr:DCC1-like thiol-disulfide oxidoreductase family protein [Candidatus Nanopelagicales bacterium]